MDDAALDQALREIRGEIRTIHGVIREMREELQALRPRECGPRLSPHDMKAAAILLPAIYDVIANVKNREPNFTVRDLDVHAAVLDHECVALRAAIIGAVGLDKHGKLNTKKLGNLFRRLAKAGIDFAGLSVEKIGDREHDGAPWALRVRRDL